MYCTQYILDTEIPIDLTLHAQGTNLTLHAQGTNLTLHTQGTNLTLHTQGTNLTLHAQGTNLTLHAQGTNLTLHAQGTNLALHAQGTNLTLHAQGTNLTLTSTVEIEPHTVELQKTSAAELGIRIMSTQRDPGVKVLNLVNKYIFNPKPLTNDWSKINT